jgi:peptidoglycan-associated lipoprotein
MIFRKIAFFVMATAIASVFASCSTSSSKGYGSDDFAKGGAGGSGAGGDGNIALPDRDSGYSWKSGVMKGQFTPVYFGFDGFEVSGAEMNKVREVANYSRRNGVKILVAGFTDSVGTEEYNRGLGDRRALAVRSALIRQGVGSGNIQTVSFGEEMLADPTNPSSERNRRVEFGIVK